MLKLKSSVAEISKVGPKNQYYLGKLDILTIEDLLYHFPFRYDDFTIKKPIAELKEGDVVTIEAQLEEITNIFTKFGKKITKARINDGTGKMDIIWFNQHYIKSQFIPLENYIFKGKVGMFNKKPSMFAPMFEPADSTKSAQQLIPVYPETAGITSKWLNLRINDVLGIIKSEKLEIPEFLPNEILIKNNLTQIEKALNQIHLPKTLTEADQGRHRFMFEEMFLELLNVEKRKSLWEEKLIGPQLNLEKNSKKIDQLENSLPFKLTDSQKTAIKEILNDLTNEHPMNRLLEGDVGTGKTVVAVFAAYLTHLNKLKTLYMAPTEILANQHAETFKKFLEPLGLKIILKTGNAKFDLDKEPYDIAIGTHALVYSETKLKNVGLVVIDEQHRFGVEQRTKILEISKTHIKPHLLTMTATPIPRTLALTLYGDLAISVLKTNPNKDKKITTKVVSEKARLKAYEWIRNKNEQTFIVCPFIEQSEAESLENVRAAEKEFRLLSDTVFKGVRTGLLHGKMKPKEKQEVIDKFKAGEIRVLISTPVIEVGIDVPEATIMVIESAERYGLASLHQLRGRVGRGSKEGFCFVMMSGFSRTSYQRLINLETITNGLELAEIDLRFRGSGDVFGTMQSGYKRFRLASLNNLELLETCKKEAENIFPKLYKYPLLEEKLNSAYGTFVGNN